MKYILTLILSLFLFLPASANVFDPVVDAYDWEVELKVYPNPSSTGNFNIELSDLNEAGPITIRVFNLIGRELYRKEVSANGFHHKEMIQLQSLPKGIYMLEVSQGDQKQTRRLSYI